MSCLKSCNKKQKLSVIGVVVIVALVIGGVVLFPKGGKDQDSTSTNNNVFRGVNEEPSPSGKAAASDDASSAKADAVEAVNAAPAQGNVANVDPVEALVVVTPTENAKGTTENAGKGAASTTIVDAGITEDLLQQLDNAEGSPVAVEVTGQPEAPRLAIVERSDASLSAPVVLTAVTASVAASPEADVANGIEGSLKPGVTFNAEEEEAFLDLLQLQNVLENGEEDVSTVADLVEDLSSSGAASTNIVDAGVDNEAEVVTTITK